jgi:hypothetical protein
MDIVRNGLARHIRVDPSDPTPHLRLAMADMPVSHWQLEGIRAVIEVRMEFPRTPTLVLLVGGQHSVGVYMYLRA